MKKRVLFVVTYFDCGGTCRSLQNLLQGIDTELVEVDLFGMVEEGMYKDIFPNSRVIPEKRWLRALMARYSQQSGLRRWESLVAKILRKVTGGWFERWIVRRACRQLAQRPYDAVVAFSEGAPTNFVAQIPHHNRIAWIHCDYASYYRLNGARDESVLYGAYNSIVCVSKFTASTFSAIYPHLQARVRSIFNLLDVAMVRSLAQKPLPEAVAAQAGFQILSIGRLDPVKRLSVIPAIAAELKQRGCRFYWRVVGPKGGSEEEYHKLMADIERYQVGDCVVWLGEQANPYPFIAQSDLLVCPSRSEACPYVVNEAKTLHVPVVCTDFGSASEFVEAGVHGYTASLEALPDVIASLILDEERHKSLVRNLAEFDYDNRPMIRSLYQLLEA